MGTRIRRSLCTLAAAGLLCVGCKVAADGGLSIRIGDRYGGGYGAYGYRDYGYGGGSRGYYYAPDNYSRYGSHFNDNRNLHHFHGNIYPQDYYQGRDTRRTFRDRQHRRHDDADRKQRRRYSVGNR